MSSLARSPKDRLREASLKRYVLVGISVIWLAAIAALSQLDVFEKIARVSAPAYGGVIALFAASPIVFYFTRPSFARTIDAIPFTALTLFHVPRILGGLVFLAYGAAGALPPLMTALVGYGDIISGAAALSILAARKPGPRRLVAIHGIGLADLAIGLMTGMVLGLQGDPRLVPLAMTPLSLILLWWVPLLATSHVAVLTRLFRS